MKFDIEIPKWAKWLAQDEDGSWRAFKRKPARGLYQWYNFDLREYVAFSSEKVEDWQSQLYEIYWE